MEKKYTIYHLGVKVVVVEARQDATHLVQIAVLGEPAFTDKPFKDWHDRELESLGWWILAKTNGTLFFNQGTQTFANGIEKSMGIVNENDDPTWDKNLGFYHGNNLPFMYTQEYIKSIINRPEVRGAAIGAFGLLNNGIKDISGANYGEPGRSVYLTKSGRTIVGKKSDGTIVLAVFDGVTGKSGLTGYQTYELAKKLGLRNAVCMDGGGSTYGEYKGVVFNSSLREGPNAIAIYYKKR